MSTPKLRDYARQFDRWLMERALPLWWERGADHSAGGFHELMALDGKPVTDAKRRARVQSRQSYTYAIAHQMGWNGDWRSAAQHGIDYLIHHFRMDDGQFCTLVSSRGEKLDPSCLLYDQAFALLAMAAVVKVLPERSDLRAAAHALFERLQAVRAHRQGGFAESAKCAFLSNPHMHLLEALLAWRDVEPGTVWDTCADRIVELCRSKFIDSREGFLREYFEEDWAPAAGEPGHVVEPGHQFEWAWLLARWGKLRNDPEAVQTARRLFAHGLRGVDAKRDAAVHAMRDDFTVTQPTARLWAQTERVKAALILAGPREAAMLAEAEKGAACLWRYLQTGVPGLWRDRFEPDGSFAEEPAPASSFYHIILCVVSLNEATKAP